MTPTVWRSDSVCWVLACMSDPTIDHMMDAVYRYGNLGGGWRAGFRALQPGFLEAHVTPQAETLTIEIFLRGKPYVEIYLRQRSSGYKTALTGRRNTPLLRPTTMASSLHNPGLSNSRA